MPSFLLSSPKVLRTVRSLVLVGALLAGCGASGDDPASVSSTSPADAPDDGTDGVGGGAEGAAPTVPADAVAEDLGPSPMETVPLSSDKPHLAVVVDLGGDCGGGTFCVDVLELLADGQWTLTPDTGAAPDPVTGTFDEVELAGLAADIDQNAIVLGPFNGLCPTEDGGTERFYRVYAPAGTDGVEAAAGTSGDGEVVLEVSSCREQLDADAPVIVALDLLMAAARPAE